MSIPPMRIQRTEEVEVTCSKLHSWSRGEGQAQAVDPDRLTVESKFLFPSVNKIPPALTQVDRHLCLFLVSRLACTRSCQELLLSLEPFVRDG